MSDWGNFFHACLNTLTAHECPHGTDEVYYADFNADILLCVTVAGLVIGLVEGSVGVLRLGRGPADCKMGMT